MAAAGVTTSPIKTGTLPPGVIKCKPTTSAAKFQYGGYGSHPDNRALGFLPGYTGTVPHVELVAGRSYGRVSRRVFKKTIDQLVVGDMIPSSPSSNNRFPKAERGDYCLPGFTGFIPSRPQQIGVTYGRATQGKYGNDSQKTQRKALNKTSVAATKCTDLRMSGTHIM